MTDPVAVQQVADELGERAPEEQLDLLAPPETEAGRAKLPELVRRAGRPPGARNKRNERDLAWLRQRFTDPRERLAAVISMNTHDLAALLSCTPFEAAQEQRLCAAILLPYWATKQPIAINVDSRQAVHLHVDLSGITRADSGVIDVSSRVLNPEEIQEVSKEDEDDV